MVSSTLRRNVLKYTVGLLLLVPITMILLVFNVLLLILAGIDWILGLDGWLEQPVISHLKLAFHEILELWSPING